MAQAYDIGRVDVSESASVSTGIANRYATAIFELANESKKLKPLESDLDALGVLLAENGEFADLIYSPVYTREEQGASVGAIAKKMKLSPAVANALSLMASKRRLFVLPHLINALRAMIADAKGEVTADITSAKALTKAQSEKLAKVLKGTVGKDVKINATVDDALIGGLVIKVGSQMIDSSVASKLAALQNSMKEVG